jgi:ankyrin repeat protein
LHTFYSLDDQLVDAAFLSDVDEVRLLLQQGADPDARDEEYQTPLLYAASDRNRDLVRVLLEAGADPNLRDQDGWAALDVAVYRRTLDIVWLLVHFGADVNARDDMGRSVLLRAVLAANGSTEILDLLQRCGARDPLAPTRAVAQRLGLSLDQQDGPSPQ